VSCGLHPEFTLLPWEEAGNSPLNGLLSFLETAGALPPPQSGNGEIEETPTSNRASSSAEATGRQLDLELVAAFT
jgi:hypothetical protein